jgi:hypothetical protein
MSDERNDERVRLMCKLSELLVGENLEATTTVLATLLCMSASCLGANMDETIQLIEMVWHDSVKIAKRTSARLN